MQKLNIIFRCFGLLMWAIIGIGASIGAVHHLDCPHLGFFAICGLANLGIQGYFVAKHTIKAIAEIKSIDWRKAAKLDANK